MGDLRGDIRHSIRIMRRQPGTTAAIVLLLGLGIGANTAMFSVVDGVLLRPLPFEEAERLVQPCETHETLGEACVAAPPVAEDWRARARTIAALGLARDNTALIRAGDAAWTVTGGLATPGLFAALRVRPSLGRGFVEEDLADGRRDVVLLSDALWRERFGADRAVIGTRILHDGEPVEIAGVLPPGFAVPLLEDVRLWRILPFHPGDEANRGWRGFRVYARLADGATIETARAELTRVQADLAREHPETVAGHGVRIRPLHEAVTGGVRPMLLLFAGALGLLLVVACVNIASLLLAQATARRTEFAVRAALGASRRDVARQILVQSALLGAAGATIAVLFALWARSGFVVLAPPGIPRLDAITMDARAFAFAAVLALLTTVAFAFTPVMQASRSDLAGLIREGAASGRDRHRARRILVAGEVALTTVLLAGALLLARGFSGLLAWQPGFDTDDLMVFWAIAPADRYGERPDATAALWRDATTAIAAIPGVRAAGTASAGPLFGGGDGEALFVPVDDASHTGHALAWFDVGPTAFAALGVDLVAGRALDDGDVQGRPLVALVNETAARRLGGDMSGVTGSRFRHPFVEGAVIEVVGVVRDVPPLTPGTPTAAAIYWPQAQRPRRATYFVVRTGGADPGTVARTIEARLASIEPDLRVFPPRRYTDLLEARLVSPRFRTLLLGAFAALAIALAAAGTYGLFAWSVALRAREIGIRMALGAARRRVVGSILAEGLLLVATGAVAGLVAAVALAHTLRSLLAGVGAADPIAIGGTLLVLAVVALVACFVPARRAARVDPVRVMRAD